MIYEQLKIMEPGRHVEFIRMEYNKEPKYNKAPFISILQYIPYQTLLNLFLGFLLQ